MKRLLFYILISSLFNSCTKILDLGNEPDKQYHITNDISKLANFKTGSIWIYHNDSLNLNDTVSEIVYKMSQVSDHFDGHINYSDKINITYKSSYCDSTIYDELNAIYGIDYLRVYNIGYKKHSKNIILEFIEIYDQGNSKYFSNIANIKYLYNFDLNGMLFDTVVCYTSNVQKNKYYFAFNTGIIKKTNIENSKIIEWNLIKYNLIK